MVHTTNINITFGVVPYFLVIQEITKFSGVFVALLFEIDELSCDVLKPIRINMASFQPTRDEPKSIVA